MGRQRAAHRTAGAERVRHPAQPGAAVRPRAGSRAASKPAGEPAEEVSRLNFIEACSLLTLEDERAYEETWRELGLSIDWTLTYATIDPRAREVSQLSFLELYRAGRVYASSQPTMWDVDFKTAVAQAEVEDRPRKSAYVDLRFAIEGGGEVVISTTRPELVGACVGVGGASRRRALPRPVRQDRDHAALPRAGADPARRRTPIPRRGPASSWCAPSATPTTSSSGRRRVCRCASSSRPTGASSPPTTASEPFASRDAERANAAHAELVGKSVEQARRRVIELLAQPGSAASGGDAALVGEPRPVEHPVKFYEKGDRPLEFMPARQWFVRILDIKDELLEQGRRIQWHPAHMRARYEHWVEGLNQDWCVSRQRFAGVAFPVWYPVRGDGSVDYESPILAEAADLPLDPLATPPRGRREEERGKPGGFVGDPDVMDTWATSSLTPQIISGWGRDPERHRRMFPMDLRPQAHEIIRTWAFYTIVKAWLHERTDPVAAHRHQRLGGSIPTARRCRSRRGTWSRRSTSSTSTRPTPTATGRRATASAPTPSSIPR